MKNTKNLVIFNAVIFAAVMLVVAYWTSSKEQGILINNFLIALWFATNGYLSRGNKNSCG